MDDQRSRRANADEHEGMVGRRTRSLLALVFAFAASMPVAAVGTYETGFEDPPIVAGPLAGQDGWFFGGTVQTSVVESGDQAVYVDGSTGFDAAARALDTPVGPLISVEVSFQVTGTTQTGISLFVDTGFLAQIVSLNSLVFLGNSNSNTPPQPLSQGTWHRLRIEFDFDAQEMEGFVDGSSLGVLAMNPAGGPAAEITDLSLYTFDAGGATQDVYFDDLSFVAPTAAEIPTVSEWGLIVLALLLLTAGTIIVRREMTLRAA
ncbi:MAG: IPTL-CTERM sorting domain-containing protein [Acidimicrobiia bacterium]|nr:IPTL-CTERM sorting domain-containing protein [Acidimicrobiia bacterium]